MNKKILAIGMLMLIMCAMAASVFAEQPIEYEYVVTVNYKYKNGSGFGTKTYTVWATSARDAEAKAMELCKYDVDTKGTGKAASCGAPNATGNSRPAK
jgi:hypothetical protein